MSLSLWLSFAHTFVQLEIAQELPVWESFLDHCRVKKYTYMHKYAHTHAYASACIIINLLLTVHAYDFIEAACVCAHVCVSVCALVGAWALF